MTQRAARRALDNDIALDFTGLFADAGGGETRLSVSPVEPLFTAGEYKDIPTEEKPAESRIEGLEGIPARKLLVESRRAKAEAQQTHEAYKTYQENTRKSEILQAEILKGARAGEDIYSLFLKAVEAISRMTSNRLFLTQIEADLRSVYGAGLLQAKPLELELEETRERLRRLQEAGLAEHPPDTQQRILAAITAHQIRAAELEDLIGKAQKTQL